MATSNYTVRTRDVDGAGVRRFATLAAAVRRFEEMSGITADNAIAEAFAHLEDKGLPLPKVETLRTLRAVSMFGTVVVLEATSAAALAAVEAAHAAATAAAAGDWVVACCAPRYGSRDEYVGNRVFVSEGPFATEAEADAKLNAMYEAFGEDGPGELDFYVVRKSAGLWRPKVAAPAMALDDGSDDIPF